VVTLGRYAGFGAKFTLLEPEWVAPLIARWVDRIVWATRGKAGPYLGDLAKLRPSVIKLARGTYYMNDAKAHTHLGYVPICTQEQGFAKASDYHRRVTQVEKKAKAE
jgi:hypothetical protein